MFLGNLRRDEIDILGIQVYVETTVDMEFSGIQINASATTFGTTYYVAWNTGYITATDVFRFNVSKQMPDITILDFLTGLFKLFNLTAYAKDGKIVVQTLDDFYSEGQGHLLGQKGIDITPYVDTDSNTVDVALPFREIFFQFADTKTFLANKFGEITGRPWGKLSYTAGEENLDGGTYQIKAPFGHLLYERLTDSFTDVVKSIQWGYNVNNDQSAYLGKPLLFYTQNELTGGISVVDEVDSDNVAVSYKQLIRAILPFNTVEGGLRHCWGLGPELGVDVQWHSLSGLLPEGWRQAEPRETSAHRPACQTTMP